MFSEVNVMLVSEDWKNINGNKNSVPRLTRIYYYCFFFSDSKTKCSDSQRQSIYHPQTFTETTIKEYTIARIKSEHIQLAWDKRKSCM